MPRQARPWFRYYVEMPTDRKVRRLSPAQRWLWTCILAAARQSPRPGYLYVADGVPMGARELADYAGMPTRSIRPAIELMQTLGMVTMENGALFVPNFARRQYESDDVTSRTRKHRERARISEDQGVLGDVGTFQPDPLERSYGVPTVSLERSRNVPGNDLGTDQRQRTEPETDLPSVNRGGNETLPATDATRCTRHPHGNPTDEPCRGCAAANEATRKAKARARDLAKRARANCPDCHGSGWIETIDGNPTSKCTHPRALALIEGGNP